MARETIASVRDEIGTLIAAHWSEVGQDKEHMRLDPDWNAYVALERAGQLFVVGARDAGRLVGYAVYFVRRHLHYRTVMVAINDLLFLHSGYRAGLAGARLISEAEALLVAHGVDKIFMGVKPWLDFGPLLARRGYAPQETTWSKWVGA